MYVSPFADHNPPHVHVEKTGRPVVDLDAKAEDAKEGGHALIINLALGFLLLHPVAS
jgi:hypothetical protein